VFDAELVIINLDHVDQGLKAGFAKPSIVLGTLGELVPHVRLNCSIRAGFSAQRCDCESSERL
jgi:hypothetical protein